jgi:hypothetical protein
MLDVPPRNPRDSSPSVLQPGSRKTSDMSPELGNRRPVFSTTQHELHEQGKSAFNTSDLFSMSDLQMPLAVGAEESTRYSQSAGQSRCGASRCDLVGSR